VVENPEITLEANPWRFHWTDWNFEKQS
jgi:hypothetical protein